MHRGTVFVLGVPWGCPRVALAGALGVSWGCPGGVLGLSWRVPWVSPWGCPGGALACPGGRPGGALGVLPAPPSTGVARHPHDNPRATPGPGTIIGHSQVIPRTPRGHPRDSWDALGVSWWDGVPWGCPGVVLVGYPGDVLGQGTPGRPQGTPRTPTGQPSRQPQDAPSFR